MSDEKIIDFGELQNKVKDSDIDKFEQYIYGMFDEVTSGKLGMFEFSKRISQYVKENNISDEKFINIQKKLMERYGIDPENIEEEIKKFGVDKERLDAFKNNNNLGVTESEKPDDIENLKRKLSFYEIYKENLNEVRVLIFTLKNEKNDLKIYLEKNEMRIFSEKKIDLSDDEVNKFIAYYREAIGETLKVIMCEATNKYEYF